MELIVELANLRNFETPFPHMLVESSSFDSWKNKRGEWDLSKWIKLGPFQVSCCDAQFWGEYKDVALSWMCMLQILYLDSS